MNDRLENFVFAYELSRRAKANHRAEHHDRARHSHRDGLLAVSRGIPLSLGVVAHEGSTVIVVLNSLRLLFMRADR